MQDVTLIFGKVSAAGQARSAVGRSHNLCMVTSRNEIKAQRLGSGHQTIKLEVPIALDARVRSDSASVIGNIRFDNVAIKVLGEVEHQMIDLELLCYSSSVIDIAH